MKITKFQNAYGIKSLKLNLENSDLNKSSVIYAPNGVFKSSFSKAIYELSRGNGTKVKDRLSEKLFECVISVNDKQYTQNDKLENVLVYSREIEINNLDGNMEYVSQLTLSVDKRTELIKIKKEVSDLVKKIRDLYKTANLTEKKVADILNINSSLEELKIEELRELLNAIDIQVPVDGADDLDFKDLATKAYDVINSDFEEKAKKYINAIEKQLDSEVFDINFSPSDGEGFLKSVLSTNFLSNRRKIVINGNEFADKDKLEKFMREKISEITEKNPEIFAAKEELKKAIGSSESGKKLIEIIEQGNMKEIGILSHGKKAIVFTALKNKLNFDLSEELSNLNNIVLSVSQLEKEAENYETRFEDAIRIHEDRFKPPFIVLIKDKHDAVLGLKTPEITFRPNRNFFAERDYKGTSEILSSGERTALNIINFIVEYETTDKENTTVILDDIVETFDYRNRIAFIQYIDEMDRSNSIVILLTHNYEFYRTVMLQTKLNGLAAHNDKNGVTNIVTDSKLNLKVEQLFKVDTMPQYIFCLPFARGIYQYLDNKEKSEFFLNLFHIKENTKSIEIGKISDELLDLGLLVRFNIDEYKNKKYFDVLVDLSNSIIKDGITYYDIRQKLIISIACRLLAEDIMIQGDYSRIQNISDKQTRTLRNNLAAMLSDSIKRLVDKVLLCTSEFIHMNSFMYEPLVDIDPKDLGDLYKELLIKHDEIFGTVKRQ